MIERARSIRPSVKMSAANRRTVCPSTPVCSKLMPAAPSAVMMICNYGHEVQTRPRPARRATHLVIPPVSTRPYLHTALELVGAAQEVVAEFRQTIRVSVVEAHHEKRVVDNLETGLVVAIAKESLAQGRPDLAVLGREHADRVLRDFVHGQLVGIRHDRLQVPQNLALREHGPVLTVQNVEPVCAAVCVRGRNGVGEKRRAYRTGPGGGRRCAWLRGVFPFCIRAADRSVWLPRFGRKVLTSVGTRAVPNSRVY